MKDNVLIFKPKPKKIKLEDIDSIGILFKKGKGVIIPKKLNRQILEILRKNNLDCYID